MHDDGNEIDDLVSRQFLTIMYKASRHTRRVDKDISPFKQDVDELIVGFGEGNLKSLSDMKRFWLDRKFSYIFDGVSASTNLALLMQSLYATCFGHMAETYTLSHRLGGLYCLYILHEIQPFKPPFKIYLSLGLVSILKALVIDSQKEKNRAASTVVRRLIERNCIVYGCVDMSDPNDPEVLKIRKLNTMLKVMHEKLFPDGVELEELLEMDMGVELDLRKHQEDATNYAKAKSRLLKEVGNLVNMEDIKHIADDAPLIGGDLEKIIEKWDEEKAAYNQEIRSKNGYNFQEKENSGITVQNLDDECQLEEESSPIKLVNTGEEMEDLCQELERSLQTEENHLLTGGDEDELLSSGDEMEDLCQELVRSLQTEENHLLTGGDKDKLLTAGDEAEDLCQELEPPLQTEENHMLTGGDKDELLTVGDEVEDLCQELEGALHIEVNHLLTGGDKHDDVSQDFGMDMVDRLLENEESQEQDSINMMEIGELEKFLLED